MQRLARKYGMIPRPSESMTRAHRMRQYQLTASAWVISISIGCNEALKEARAHSTARLLIKATESVCILGLSAVCPAPEYGTAMFRN